MALRILLFIIIFNFAWSISGDAGRTAAIFELGHGARALAMGSAFVAHEPEAASLYWNPAGLGYVTQREVATLHAGLPTDASYFYLGGVYPTDIANFGLSWVQLQMADIPETTTVNEDNEVTIERYLTYTETAAACGVGITLNTQLAVGLAVKTITKEIDGYGQGHGMASLCGLFYRASSSLNIGVVVDDFSSTVQYDSGYIENTPAIYRLGIAYTLLPQLICLIDIDRRAEASSFIRGHAGLEYQITQQTYLAGGYDVDRLTVGAGFSWQGIYAQYAFLSENRYSPGTEQFITLGVRW